MTPPPSCAEVRAYQCGCSDINAGRKQADDRGYGLALIMWRKNRQASSLCLTCTECTAYIYNSGLVTWGFCVFYGGVSTSASRPESKSLHQNWEKCEASFHRVINDVCCCETLRRGPGCGLCRGLAGERYYLLVYRGLTCGRRCRLRQARWLSRSE